jgi:hypothetical protein
MKQPRAASAHRAAGTGLNHREKVGWGGYKDSIDSYLYLYLWRPCPLAVACDFADPPAWAAAGWDAASRMVSSWEAVKEKSPAGWRSGRET